MERYELEKEIDDLSGMVFGEMGSDMMNNSEEDTVKVLKIMKAAKKIIIERNNDIEDLKEQNGRMIEMLNEIRNEVKIIIYNKKA